MDREKDICVEGEGSKFGGGGTKKREQMLEGYRHLKRESEGIW